MQPITSPAAFPLLLEPNAYLRLAVRPERHLPGMPSRTGFRALTFSRAIQTWWQWLTQSSKNHHCSACRVENRGGVEIQERPLVTRSLNLFGYFITGQTGSLPPCPFEHFYCLNSFPVFPVFRSTCFLELALEGQSIMSPQWQADQYVSTQTPQTCCYDNVGSDRVTAQWAQDRTSAVKRPDEKHESLLEGLRFPLHLYLSPLFSACVWNAAFTANTQTLKYPFIHL